MTKQYRLSTSSVYSICGTYDQDWANLSGRQESQPAAKESEFSEPTSLNSSSVPPTHEDSPSAPNAQKTASDTAPPVQQPSDRPPPSRVCDWTVEDVVSWASSTTMALEVASWFRKHEISGAVLQSLTEADLLAMGMEPFGRRRQLLLSRQLLLEGSLGMPSGPSRSCRSTDSAQTCPWLTTLKDSAAKVVDNDPWWFSQQSLGSSPTPLRALAKRVAAIADVPTPEHIKEAETREVASALSAFADKFDQASSRETMCISRAFAATVTAAPADPLPRAQQPAPVAFSSESSLTSWLSVPCVGRRARCDDHPHARTYGTPAASFVSPVGACGSSHSPGTVARSFIPPLAASASVKSLSSTATTLIPPPAAFGSASRATSWAAPLRLNSARELAGAGIASPGSRCPTAACRSSSQGRSMIDFMDAKAQAIGSALATASKQNAASMREISQERRSACSRNPGFGSPWNDGARSLSSQWTDRSGVCFSDRYSEFKRWAGSGSGISGCVASGRSNSSLRAWAGRHTP
eukprot:TRINITY_DN23941_c0_g1_i1.p1 TRINITY_DN23941_c0_g1~~TRINITY_DN23941_c0_g1_i1.p1  ORF type:complete len:536 (-),score=60.90 TRINITY_DN23941_c0_g1_i1:76-1641(-)